MTDCTDYIWKHTVTTMINPDIIFIDDPFDDTVCTEKQKEKLRKFCEKVIIDRADPPILKVRYHDKNV